MKKTKRVLVEIELFADEDAKEWAQAMIDGAYKFCPNLHTKDQCPIRSIRYYERSTSAANHFAITH